MIVKDLLEQSPEEDIARELFALCAEEDTDSPAGLQSCLELIARIKAIAPVETDGLLLGNYYTDEGEERFDTVLFHKAELAAFEPHPAWDRVDTVDELPDEELEQLIPLLALPDTYAYELSPWKEILGYEVNPENVSAVGSPKFAAAVLYEMTFFGITEETIDLERQKLKESLTEADKIFQLPTEEREAHFYSVEDVFADLGIRDERTEEEKTQQDHEMLREIMENHLRTYRLIQQYRG
jgi:hypothetical protein